MREIETGKVCFVVVKARELGAKVDVDDPDSGSNASDDGMRSILEDFADDGTYAEVKQFIDGLDSDEQTALVALTWLGRGDFDIKEWPEALAQARAAHNERTADYLLGMPLLADFLEEGLSLHGESCEDFEMGRL